MTDPALVCIVGPPASGKSLLILWLTEAFRQRGKRVASVVLRDHTTTAVTLPSGGRVTLSRAPGASELVALVRSLDPNVDLVLAEGFSAPGMPTVELLPPDGPPLATPDADLLAVVASARIVHDFATLGSGETDGLANLIEARLLAPREQSAPKAAHRRGFLDRLRRRS